MCLNENKRGFSNKNKRKFQLRISFFTEISFELVIPQCYESTNHFIWDFYYPIWKIISSAFNDQISKQNFTLTTTKYLSVG